MKLFVILEWFPPAAAATTTGWWVGSGTIGVAVIHSSQFSKLLLTWKIYNDVSEEEKNGAVSKYDDRRK